MSYPFFRCISCRNYVQRAVGYEKGKLPSIMLYNKHIALCDSFEDGDFASHCRGQGLKFHESAVPAFVDHVDGHHFNFSGVFKGHCCFCALHAGYGTELFLETACHYCLWKEEVLGLFGALYQGRSKRDSPVSWSTHRWAALPSALLDKILQNVLIVMPEDGRVAVMAPRSSSEMV